ncbi:hypothetical protein AVEN_183609-1 [Araneus ventricosus]|uniref:Uncharacterized protein n=1 Tax=Araneus ventricosus TaxID=182803 RepID=A0A4Y2UNM3_ARAVE|nr:hypothetical protein AVEN_183609-1 [Araneus ventricosus]
MLHVKSYAAVKSTPDGVVRKFGEWLPAQAPSALSDSSSKFLSPSPNSPRVASKRDVNRVKLNLIFKQLASSDYQKSILELSRHGSNAQECRRGYVPKEIQTRRSVIGFTPAALSSFPPRKVWGRGEVFLRIRRVQSVIAVFESASEFLLSLKEPAEWSPLNFLVYFLKKVLFSLPQRG